MEIRYHRRFEKEFKKLPKSIQERFYERQTLWLVDSQQVLLADHALSGAYAGDRSFNSTGDVRLIYRPIGKNAVRFLRIGTHHELYGT